MSLLLQMTDTHILAPGKMLYDSVDTALHLKQNVARINHMRPLPEAVMITGDIVDQGDMAGYEHFIRLIRPLKMPVYVIPGNHDDPQVMRDAFAETPYFPGNDATFQYVVDRPTFRILALNSKATGTELPAFGEDRLQWLSQQLQASEKPALLAIHHPPMKTGIELIDMGGTAWFRGLAELLDGHAQVKLVICGHCHTDLCGRIGNVPVYMAPATSHQLMGCRAIDIAPSTIIRAGVPTLHHFIDGQFLSGSNAWPEDIEEQRIDVRSGLSWDRLKRNMMGSRAK
jgi:3',5'-cyclic AMP phosphodiesterase CpdA